MLSTRYAHVRLEHSQQMAARVSIPAAAPRESETNASPVGKPNSPRASRENPVEDSTRTKSNPNNQPNETLDTAQDEQKVGPNRPGVESIVVDGVKYTMVQLAKLVSLGRNILEAAGKPLSG
jgi:cell division septation protein DedD